MTKLSVSTVQTRLLEADHARKVSYETMKKNGTRLRTISALNDPSTKITNIKQVSVPKSKELHSQKGSSLLHQADFAGSYVDKMPRGIFKDHSGGGAPSTPSVKKMKPNQSTNQEKVTPNMQKGTRKSESSPMNMVPRTAEMAGNYVDRMDRGDIYSKSSESSGVKAPSAKNLHGTTRPKSSRKTANMTRNPVERAKGPEAPSDNYPMPSDAPKKRTVEHVKSGVLVRVNESVKARFDIVSETVLRRMIETYQRHGYKVIVEQNNTHPRWKSDRTFLRLLHETVAARENQSNALYQRLRNGSLNRLYHLCRPDYNNLYESRDEFLKTLRNAFKKIEESAILNYRKNLNLYIGKARIVAESKICDVEILAEAIDHQMALRLIRNRLMEHFGLAAEIRHIFIDGRKYLPEQIKEWIPRVRMNEEEDEEIDEDGPLDPAAGAPSPNASGQGWTGNPNSIQPERAWSSQSYDEPKTAVPPLRITGGGARPF